MALESPDAASPFLFPNTVSNAPASQDGDRARDQGAERHDHAEGPRGAQRALLRPDASRRRQRADALLVGAADEWNLDYHLAYERVRATRTSDAARLRPRRGRGRASSSRTEIPARARGAPGSSGPRRLRRLRPARRSRRRPAGGSGDARRRRCARPSTRRASRRRTSGSSTSRETASSRRTPPRRPPLAVVFGGPPARGRRQGEDRREPVDRRRPARARGRRARASARDWGRSVNAFGAGGNFLRRS